MTARSTILRRCLARAARFVLATVVILATVTAGSAQQTDAVSDATANLFTAVHANDYAGVQAAIAAGAEFDARDRWGLTAVDLAIDKGHFQIAHYLLSVRNFRRDDKARERERPAVAPAAAALPTPAAAGFSLPSELVGTSPAAAPAPSPVMPALPVGPVRAEALAEPKLADSGLTAASGPSPDPVWPSDQPNPFDPSQPAPGVMFAVIGEADDDSATEAPMAR